MGVAFSFLACLRSFLSGVLLDPMDAQNSHARHLQNLQLVGEGIE